MNSIQIMIVEDDMIIAADISMQLTQLGYGVMGIFPRAEDAMRQLEHLRPDILLLDIQLKGSMDGIELASAIQQQHPVPIIYLTANADRPTFERAKATKPLAFIAKPFDQDDLERTLELVADRLRDQNDSGENGQAEEEMYKLDDRIFIKQRQRMVKLFIREICYVAADRNYCQVFTSNHEYLLSISLGQFEDRLRAPSFIRVHRSYLVNVSKIDELADNGSTIIIGSAQIPVSKSYQEGLMNRLKLF